MSEDTEVQAMFVDAKELEPLDEAARRRALEWLWSRFGGAPPVGGGGLRSGPSPTSNATQSEFQTFAELFDAANPNTDKERALIAAYWTQIGQSQPNFPAQTLNSALKDLGHGVSNITDSLDALKDEKPSLILQLKKSGTSRQARKIYKLTEEGARRVRSMISKEE